MNTKLLKKVLASTLALSMVIPIGVANADKQNTQQETKTQQVTRIFGKDRIQTSVEISKSAYTTSENVVLASGLNFADALSAGQLASALNAPLLLSSQNKLDAQTKNEIERLKAKKVYVVGGDNAISKNGVDTTLKSENIDVTRLEGQDRYSTSQKVMEKTKEIIKPEYLLIASGKNFPDALAATSFFVNHKSVMVLSDGETYPQSNLQEIAIGGVNQLPLKGFEGKRVSGKDRYETALQIAKISFDKNNNAILASGQVFADSLSAVSLTKKHNAPIILTQSNSLTENAKKYLNGKNVFIVGGEKTVVNKIMTNITTEERAKIGSFNLEEEIEKVLAKKKKNDNVNLEKEIERILAKNQAYQNLIIKQEVEKALSEKQIGKSTNLEKEIEKILDKKQSNQNVDLEKEINRVITKRRAKDSLDSTEASIADAKKRLAEYKEKLKKYKEDPENIKKFEEQLKIMQEKNEEYEKFNKEKIDQANKRIEEVDKAIPLIDKRVNEGAFAFFEWVAENRPTYKKDADNALAILNEYYKKGDVKKTSEDATSYKNLLASADLLKQFKEFDKTKGYFSTNLSILAKTMVSCNRNVYSSNKNTFNAVEHLYSGEGNPIEYWYNDGKAVHDELIKIIKEKYTNDDLYSAMEKAKEDYKKSHGKEPDLGLYGELLNRQYDIVAIATNSSKIGTNKNLFCLNGETQNSYGTWIDEGIFSLMIEEYNKILNKQELLKNKERAQQTIKEVEEYKKEREKDFERIKNKEDGETIFINSDIRDTEALIARLEKEYKEKKAAYEKLK
ncbi:cell wall-binding repeat-containing protein [Finegoldia magna]|uniref:cell wall-binding repeat-containing protein n=1 Tax=Finegoldia magna TaxID=1260 RepID=UPI000B919B4A|nr:cell wall-binding repeat-containing protein [Finegoldia magna]OXZ26293.1 N-acetylmuramoyl-L-alanine amidase [Finegoldia magna]